MNLHLPIQTRLLLIVLAAGIFSCSPKNITGKYYFQNEKILDKIEESYKELYEQGPFAVAFTDKQFHTVSIEIITDSLKYIYEFGEGEERMTDTLERYGLNAERILQLINRMQSIRCTWINKFDFYVDEKKNTLIFMSVKPVALQAPFSNKKYYILTYFNQPQAFDEEGRLLDKRKQRRLRIINGEILHRINDKVCYTISDAYR